VLNVYAPQGGRPSAPPQAVLTKMSEVQRKLVSALALKN
jgi:hypothetical protein